MWFQQDGATAHTAGESIQFLKTLFPNWLISRFGNAPWALRSPDLTLLDFFSRENLQEKLYVNRPSNLEDLKATICREIRSITSDLVISIMNHLTKNAHVYEW